MACFDSEQRKTHVVIQHKSRFSTLGSQLLLVMRPLGASAQMFWKGWVCPEEFSQQVSKIANIQHFCFFVVSCMCLGIVSVGGGGGEGGIGNVLTDLAIAGSTETQKPQTNKQKRGRAEERKQLLPSRLQDPLDQAFPFEGAAVR